MSAEMEQRARACLRVIPDFPKPGIKFRDISPLLQDAQALKWTIQQMAAIIQRKFQTCQVIAGLDARGFIFGGLVAQELNVPFVMIRKPSKLPGERYVTEYKLEYGSNQFELAKNAIQPGQHVVLIDDVLATGGSLVAAASLIEQAQGRVDGSVCVLSVEVESKSVVTASFEMQVLWKSESGVLTPFATHPPTTFSSRDVETWVPAVPNKNENTYLAWHPSMYPLAIKLLFKWNIRALPIMWETFPDGFPHLRFPDQEKLEDLNVVYLGSLADMSLVATQVSLLMALARQGIKSLKVVFPYFGAGTMERVDPPGTVATAEPLAKLISCIPSTKSGIPQVYLFDLHVDTIRFYAEDKIRVIPKTAVPLVLQEFHKDNPQFAVAFPDEGSYKRFHRLIPDWVPVICCTKFRGLGDERTIQITKMTNFPSKFDRLFDQVCSNILIVDDLVHSGGTMHQTMLGLQSEMKKLGVPPRIRVSAYCTHAVFEDDNWKHFLPGGKYAGFESFYITDSIPRQDPLPLPFKTLSIVPLFESIVSI